ncbi:Hypothetical predicted protein [Lynx pardinus]|uniref:Uncharacterized protein n=1 Tax=Lynx pardinus TaxID=191816 RepID=A0A485MJB8_LYNPA|nr:Hypothetical predicted protein [Lynx pardinus]
MGSGKARLEITGSKETRRKLPLIGIDCQHHTPISFSLFIWCKEMCPPPVAAVVASKWLKTSALTGLHPDLLPSFPILIELPVPCSCLQ